jgi:hypothetical protein
MALNIKPPGDRGLMLPSRQRLGVRRPSGAFHAAAGKWQRAAAVQNLAELRKNE